MYLNIFINMYKSNFQHKFPLNLRDSGILLLLPTDSELYKTQCQCHDGPRFSGGWDSFKVV